MKALREWLIRCDWYIVFCDPVPDGDWKIKAISPTGEAWLFLGTSVAVSDLVRL